MKWLLPDDEIAPAPAPDDKEPTMSAQQALAVLSYYENERASAHSSGMDWMPSRTARQEITDALATIWASERVSLAQKEAADGLDPWAYHRPDGSLQVSDE